MRIIQRQHRFMPSLTVQQGMLYQMVEVEQISVIIMDPLSPFPS